MLAIFCSFPQYIQKIAGITIIIVVVVVVVAA
jgi:hypothetical protein